MEDKRLFLLDAYALIYRAYYALIRSPRINSKGFNTSAIFGFCNTLAELLKKETPSHIAVCFDPHGPTFRHEMYDAYKATRQAQPEDISRSVPFIKEIIAAYNIPIFEVAGFEADDVIGTISVKAAAEGFTTYMMTPDKDYGQLVTPQTFILKPPLRGGDPEILGPEQVCSKYGISSPLQVIDLLALEGDTADNIPGCPGVGPKKAAALIHDYGTVENMLSHAGEIPGALGNNVRENAQQIIFSKKLATIRTDVPVEVDFARLRRSSENTVELRRIFTELEFNTMLARMGEAPAPAAAAKPAPKPSAPAADAQPSLFDFVDGGDFTPKATEVATNNSAADYKAITTNDEINALVSKAVSAGFVGISVYAVGAEAMTATLRGIAVSTSAESATYIPLTGVDTDKKIALLAPLFAHSSVTLVSHDIKRDMVILRCHGVALTANYEDTSLAHYVLQPEMRHRLADVAFTVLNYRMAEYDMPSMTRNAYAALPEAEEMMCVCEQADMVRRLAPVLTALLKENAQEELYRDIELPLATVLADMEYTGVRISTSELHRQSLALSARLAELEEAAYTLAGERFNISSPMQVGEILFGKLKLDPKAKRTKTGAYSTTEEILEKHRHNHPLVDLILEVRGLRKLLTTYVNALPELVNPTDGKIHTTYNQTVTATGRLSSTNPNLQNIPIRTPDGRQVRSAFIADDGCEILSADYSQIELRLLASLSRDPDLCDAFARNLDIHRATASKIYHVPFEEVTDTQRRNAKTANFGTIYGISAFGLSERLGIPRSEAKELIDGYFATYPHIREYIQKAVADAKETGYVTTIMGRKRFLPDINSRNATVRAYAERNAVNAPLQGSAADIIKLAMIRVFKRISAEGLRSKMVLQVHDELVFNVYPEETERLRTLVIEEMEGAYGGPVRLEVSAGLGHNWLEAH